MASERLCLKMGFQKNRTIVLKTLKSCIKQSILYIILYRHQGNPWHYYVRVKYLTKRNKCAGCVFFYTNLLLFLKIRQNETKG